MLLLANKISKSIGIIHKASFFLNKQSLRILYFSMIYPYLQYYNLVWSNTYQTIMSRLQTLQKRIIRVINKSHFLAHTNPILKSLYLLKLEDIRKLQISQFMFSIRNNLTPIGFHDMFTARFIDIIPEQGKRTSCQQSLKYISLYNTEGARFSTEKRNICLCT